MNRKKKPRQSMLDFNLNSLARQMDEIKLELGKERTPAEARRYLIHLFNTLSRLVSVYDQLTLFPDWDPTARANEREVLDGCPEAFGTLIAEAFEVGNFVFNLDAIIERKEKQA